MEEKILGGILGLCVADAVGVPFEFHSRKSLAHDPVTDMCGYGTYNQPAGTWSDDTSMTLCLLDSLSNGLDYTDIMQKFLSWLNEAKFTPHNEVFDVGRTSREAIIRFAQGVPPLCCGGASEHDIQPCVRRGTSMPYLRIRYRTTEQELASYLLR